jgi:hypothetical protein
VLPSILLPLWDLRVGKGVHRDAALDPGRKRGLLIRTFLQDVIVAEVGSRWTIRQGSGRIRVQFVASQLVGVVMARYILELDPFRRLPSNRSPRAIATEPAALPHRRSPRPQLAVDRLSSLSAAGRTPRAVPGVAYATGRKRLASGDGCPTGGARRRRSKGKSANPIGRHPTAPSARSERYQWP